MTLRSQRHVKRNSLRISPRNKANSTPSTQHTHIENSGVFPLCARQTKPHTDITLFIYNLIIYLVLYTITALIEFILPICGCPHSIITHLFHCCYVIMY